MKNLFFLIFSLLLSNCLFAQDFIVNNYSVDITLQKEGNFDVVEKYDLTFESPKHGIFRDIITRYDFLNTSGEQEERIIEISKIKVPNHHFEATSKFAQRLGDNVQIKIGEADINLEGAQHYEIIYSVKNAFIYEENQINFYWNIKPSDWYAPFNKIDFKVHLPDGVNLVKGNYFLYSGSIGSTAPASDFVTKYSNRIFSGATRPNMVSFDGEAVTVLLKLPLGSIQENKPIWPFWSTYGWTIILTFVYIAFYAIWKKHGKDDHVTTTTSYYPPKGMDPAMVGFLIDDSGDTSDMISLIPFWASRGYLTIEEIDNQGLFAKDDTKLTKLKELEDEALPYQKQIYNGLFASKNEVLVSGLKEKFYTTMGTAKGGLKEAAQIYYVNKSRKIKNYTMGGIVLATLILAPTFIYFWGVIAFFAVIFTCILLLIVSQYFIKKNKEGSMILSELKGFKQFIKIAEENKLKMLLKEDPTYFESTMSYALAFGMFEKWAKKFDGLNLAPPTWYYSTSGRMMTMSHFSKSFNSSMSSAQSTMVSSPSSSGGGGSSGGGFGGGGGGSW
jgi:uncharacterized membrane protein YgcG